MSSLKQKFGNVKGRLTRTRDFVDSIEESTTLEMLEIRLKNLKDSWSEFSELYTKIIESVSDEQFEGHENEFGLYETRFFESHSRITSAMRSRQADEKSNANYSVVEQLARQQSTFLEKINATSEDSPIQLPKFTVPIFSGDYKDWPSFRDSFTGSVDNKKNLSATQKFHYLKSFLRDEAANLIKHMAISEANYLEAWERLESRYDRVHLIVQSFIQTFLNLPTVTPGNVKGLRKLSDGADEVIRGLNALKSNGRDPWLVYLLLNKVDSETKQSWAEHNGGVDSPEFSELLQFLEARCNALESCQTLARTSPSRNQNQPKIRTHVTEASQVPSQCPKCNEQHILSQCPQFTQLSVDTRRSFVKNNSLCFNCLRAGHSAKKCRSNFSCRECKSRHHSLVHLPGQNNPTSSSLNSSSSNSSSHTLGIPIVSNHLRHVSLCKQTILPTIVAQVKNNQGNLVACRILLDSGSQNSFITESFAQKLGIRREHARVPIRGVSTTDAGHTRGIVSIKLYSRINQDYLCVDAFILSKLTSNLPSQPFDSSSWPHIRDLDLADPEFNIPKPVDMLLGADKFWYVIKEDQIQGPTGVPVAQNTMFGWVVTGQLLDSNSISRPVISSLLSTLDVDGLLQRFWELDEVSSSKIDLCHNDEAEINFRKTFTRSLDGKYVVQLPFKVSSPVFGNSLKSAVNRLYAMERRFQRDSKLRDMYTNFMQEYQDLGHMTRIPPSELENHPGKYFYLPHHAVLKPDSSTTKLRVVFDGSAKDSDGKSLNSQLLVGPPIQRDLIGVCLRFRQFKYVFTADVVKMFRQIWVADEHCDYQRIVWRNNASDNIEHYRLRTVTYGTSSAPFLSVRVLKQLSEDYKNQYPRSARVLCENVYVDDIMAGANSIDDLMSLQSELVSLLSKAQFQLRKWNSNCWSLLSRLPKEDCQYSPFETDCSESLIKVLGLYWDPNTDQFSFRMTESRFNPTPTRRSLLSEISRIFDPLGFLAPSVILFKMLFQQLWSSELKLDWDDPLPSQLADKWIRYQKELHYFEQIRIPRNVFSSLEEVELHGFADASSLAYAAVVYVRSKIGMRQYKTVLVAAKTKVAPLKPVSIPRLELCAALLLCKLISMVRSSITMNVKILAWTDSEIVLHWLASPPRRWNSFVANRTAQILESIPRYAWNHIASEWNPADCASRGVIPSALNNHSLWWSGPSWLSLPSDRWPTFSLVSPENKLSHIEERNVAQLTFITYTPAEPLHNLILKISSWTRLVRIVAYVVRFLSNCRPNKFEKNLSGLTFNEIQNSKILILKCVQTIAFGSDINLLANKRPLPHKSNLLRYTPFIDTNGLLRVGGRIKNANLTFNIKHPILLPNNLVSPHIVKDIHNKYQHPGVSETFVIVRQRYWILSSRNLIRKVVHQCKACFEQRKTMTQQLMGDLPSPRVQASRPFLNSGCDYAGPFTIKLSRGRNPRLSKAYMALFVCMSTKAIHLELVSDLTTDAFLAAFRRFVARRGKCSNVYSDNGTNFQGARRCLNEMQRLTTSQSHNEDIAASLALDGTEWHFIPPSAPHFGGLWEAGVRSVKLHLRRVIGSSILTFEELYTVLTQIESVLNSRPLCAISDEDLNPLTPAHFLIGEPYTTVPEPSYLDVPQNRLSHWNHLQSMVQGFWKRWHLEYITSLQERPKWQNINRDLEVGDLVVIKEPNLPPAKWLLGRIEVVHPGSDDKIRVATIRKSRGTFIRPVTKLSALPLS